MTISFHHWHSHFKIALFMGVCLLIVSIVMLVWIKPCWEKLQLLQRDHTALNSQWQQQHLAMVRRQQLLHDLVLLRYPYLSRLSALHPVVSPATIYTQMTRLLKTQALQIVAIKPQQPQKNSDLIQQLFSIEINGPEANAFNFLRLLMHQPWLIEIQQLELAKLDRGVHLQATVAVYYA